MANIIESLRSRFRHLRNVAGPAATAVLVVLVLLLIASISYLIISGGPWERKLVSKLAKGSNLTWQQYRQWGVGWGMVGLSALLAFAISTARWWMLPCRPVLSDSPRQRFPKAAAQLYILALLVTVGVALFSRVPRLNHSFWNDEEMAFRKYVYGETKVQKDGTLQHQSVDWSRALFENEKANNHLWSTLESRIAMGLWNHPEAGSPTGVPAFQEWAPRIFPMVSSCLTLLALGWLGWLLGVPRIGLCAALLLALSPWHIRYSVEIRGYSTMLLGILLSLGCLISALESGRWKWWFAYAASQALYLLCFAGSAYVAVGINVLAIACICFNKQSVLGNALRLVVANVFTAVPVCIFLTPALMQISAYVKDKQEDFVPLGGAWIQDLWSHLLTAMPWTFPSGLETNGTSVLAMCDKSPWLHPVFTYVFPLLAVGGLIIMLVKQWRSRLVAGGLLLAAALSFAQASFSQAQLLSWYLLYLLPLVCLALPYLSALAPRKLGSVSFAIVALYFFSTMDPRWRLVNSPRQPMRETVQLARGETTVPVGQDPLPITAVFSTSDRQIKSYDPRAIVLPEATAAEKLTDLMQEARQTRAPLTVYFCNRTKAKEKYAAVMKMLEDDTQWSRLNPMMGLEHMFSYDIYRLGMNTPAVKLK